MPTSNHNAPGAPGIAPRWTSSAKDGIGTAYHTSSRLWFTLSHGIVNEVYYPARGHAQHARSAVSHHGRRDVLPRGAARSRPPDRIPGEKTCLLYRLTNSDRKGRYRIVKEIIGEPHSSVLLMHTRLEILDPKLRGKLRLYALLAPHLKGTGKTIRRVGTTGRPKVFPGQREDVHMVFGCAPDFTRRSVGYVGHSDGWQDLMDNFKMDWEFEQATDGNIALTGEIDLSHGLEFIVAVAFGRSAQSASTQLLQALATPFAEQREKYVSQWQRTVAKMI
jgi:glucoamylase